MRGACTLFCTVPVLIEQVHCGNKRLVCFVKHFTRIAFYIFLYEFLYPSVSDVKHKVLSVCTSVQLFSIVVYL